MLYFSDILQKKFDFDANYIPKYMELKQCLYLVNVPKDIENQLKV